MKKNYFLFLLICPLVLLAQITITSTEIIDLSGYGLTNNEPAGQGEYEIFLSDDTILDKPIIIIDGFDPGNTRGITDIYNSLDFNGSAEAYRMDGFDIIILNFPVYMNSNNVMVDGGADFIERNAMILVALIEEINTQKAAASSPEPNVIIGPSMGGLISRYALNYMETTSGLEADTRLWISLDAPHLGANVPIGLQHQFNYLANNSLNPVAEVQPIVNDVLNSPAAKQLLIDHFESHLDSSSDGVTFAPSLTLPIPSTFRDTFESNINSLTATGFPQNVRKVAVVNGSGIGAPYQDKLGNDVTLPFSIVATTLQINDVPLVGTVDVEININMTPAVSDPPSTDLVSQFRATGFGGFLELENSIALSGTTNFDGVDAAPGGLFDLSAFTGNIPTTGLAADFITALTIDKFSFIPTVSALALEITDEGNNADNVNWYHDISISSSRATTNNTPFDNTFIPDANEDHVLITAANAAFIDEEIRQTTLSASDEPISKIKLLKNPISNQLVLQSSINQNASIEIIDLTGKLVLQTDTNLGNRTSIPVHLNSGFYILNINGADNSRFTTKFIVNK